MFAQPGGRVAREPGGEDRIALRPTTGILALTACAGLALIAYAIGSDPAPALLAGLLLLGAAYGGLQPAPRVRGPVQPVPRSRGRLPVEVGAGALTACSIPG
ncbi:hypothetical protein ACIQRW_14365 [Streptomyces sp. NPDC091287]|uniref:hypothetical protein n=1 Tax=Streptomyces sp. NPDC091287 TaxID=3365988 RepID=UPI003811C934